jgi:hypothetical protein
MRWRWRLLLVLLLGSGARYISTHATTESQTDKSSVTIPTLLPEIADSADLLDKLPSVGDCIVETPGTEAYVVAPCSRPHFGKVLKQLQASDYTPPVPDFVIVIPGASTTTTLPTPEWKCPPASDGVLTMSPPPDSLLSQPHNYCVDIVAT